MTKTTKADFKLFKAECERWIGILGLCGYDFEYAHSPTTDEESFAEVTWEVLARSAYINLGDEWMSHYEKTDEKIRECAFHEVLHVFIGKLSNLARARYVKEREIEEEEHAIIRTLESVLFPKY